MAQYEHGTRVIGSVDQEASKRGVREFDTGATRNDDSYKYDYEAFFSPLVLARRAEYMHKHRVQPDGRMRDGDNWQKGMSLSVYIKSAFRHFMQWWALHRNNGGAFSQYLTEEAVCALMFNCEGYLHEILKVRADAIVDRVGGMPPSNTSKD